MKFHGSRNGFHRIAAGLSMALALTLSPVLAVAQDAPAAEVEPAVEAPVAADAAATDVTAADAAAPAAGSYTPMKPTAGKGMPVERGIDVQDQYSPTGDFAHGLHIGLVWVMAIISAFVLLLFIIVIVRFNAKANPVPSKTSHNTLIEVIWTVVPALILLGIAIPSITLISKQYKSPPKDAITVKAIGYQWYWGYNYPDNGDFEVVSNMLKEKADVKAGERFRTDDDGPSHLAVDNRMVLPVGVPIRLQTTAADVIHSFAVPSLWFKLDAVPGRLNEKMLIIKEPGVYFGQCSELCGARHGYMPIAIEALPLDQFNAWVVAQGGTVKGAKAEEAAAPAAAPAAAAPAEGEAAPVAAEATT
ncbi:cytochrome c oxidase subunit II [Qipengyuania sp. RANM35]|uniref:cytochrome c oxidase subunit II n=1 Tax=Qipengyuania sp. RANM35 TaxID=3068635 RepID=UPI0034DADCFA